MKRQYVESTAIRSFGYNLHTSTLEIEYINGGVWQYFEVEEDIYEELKSAESRGKFVNEKIKGFYDEVQVA